MMDKEAQIGYIISILNQNVYCGVLSYQRAAEALYATGYRKLPMGDCPECYGSGIVECRCEFDSIPHSSDKCPVCHGTGKPPERPEVLSDEDTACYGPSGKALKVRTFKNACFSNVSQESIDENINILLQAQACKIVEEGEKPCPHPTASKYGRRRECPDCWAEFKEEAGL